MKATTILNEGRKTFNEQFKYLCENYGRQFAIDYFSKKLNEEGEEQQSQQPQQNAQRNQQVDQKKLEEIKSGMEANFKKVKDLMGLFMKTYQGVCDDAMNRVITSFGELDKTIGSLDLNKFSELAGKKAEREQQKNQQQQQAQRPAANNQTQQAPPKQESLNEEGDTNEGIKDVVIGTALGAASLLGGGGQAQAARQEMPASATTITYKIPADTKYDLDQLIKMFPAAYADRDAKPDVWSRNRVKYCGTLPLTTKEGKHVIDATGLRAAKNGENPWNAICARYLKAKEIKFADAK